MRIIIIIFVGCISLAAGFNEVKATHLHTFSFKELCKKEVAMESIEIWEDIPGYKGYYQASNLGRIKSMKRASTNQYNKENLILKLIETREYLYSTLYKNGKVKRCRVNILVAMTFLNHIPGGNILVINHINFNKKDNRSSNLEIITHRQNSDHAHLPSTSKFVGVSWDSRVGKWAATIWYDNKNIFLGGFNEEEEANQYYQDALMCITNNTPNDIKIKRVIRSSKYKGITWDKVNKKWRAVLWFKGKSIAIGRFINEHEAHLAYQSKLKEII